MFHKNVGVPVRSSTKYLFFIALALGLIGVGYALYLSRADTSASTKDADGGSNRTVVRAEIPLASLPRSAWPKLPLPAGIGQKSSRIPVPQQMHVEMGGGNFRFHCVYADGHEESFGPGEKPCSDGDMPFVYATNTSEHANVVSYAYASR